MANQSTYFLTKLPLRNTRWLVVALLAILALVWLQGSNWAWFAGAWVLALLTAAVGKKFELDGMGRRYRTGMHLAHWLNPAWQPLPPIQYVVVKPYSYQQVRRSPLTAVAHDSRWQGFTVLLSVPGSAQGVVVSSVEEEQLARQLAAEVAFVLEVPWRQV